MAEEKKVITIHLPNISVWMITTLILAIVLVVVYLKGFPTTGFAVLTSQQAANKAIDYINKNLVQTGTASLVSVEEMSGVYKVITSYQGQQIPVYVTKDGLYLFVSQPINMAQEITKTTTQPQQVPKTDKPTVELYVMSFCPYGNRAENTMLPVYNLLKDKVDWKIYYIVSVSDSTVSSLHGQPEVDENEREACVLSEYGLDKWWNFTVYVNNNCGSSGDCWEKAANQAGIDVNKIKDCVSKKGLELMKESESATDKAGATGSPTLIINGVKSNAVYQYGNSEAYKQAICEAFKSPPEECSKVLESSSSGASGGQC
ncbi:MAG: hypothetical protein QXX38_03405 [Candidatus Aenigmatarchaeota archaeon]